MSLPPLAILAGGLGTRLGALGATVPKAMMTVAGEPFCAIQLRQLRRQGFARVVYLLGRMGDQIRDFVGDGASFGLQVEYSEDGPLPLGTGGAVLHAIDRLGDRFFVTYGDTFLRYDPHAAVAALDQPGAAAVLTVLHNRDQWDRSNVMLRGGFVVRYEKGAADREGMEWIDYGASLFTRAAFSDRRPGEAFDLADQLRLLARQERLAGLETTDRFYEIGTPAALAEADAFFRQQGDAVRADR